MHCCAFSGSTLLYADCAIVVLLLVQGDVIRKLKESGRPKMEINEAVSELKARKKKLEEKVKKCKFLLVVECNSEKPIVVIHD